jgi:glutaconate CoA-transferase subunit A
MAPRFLDAAGAVAELVAPGLTLGVGGMHMTAAPMALVGEVVRRRLPIGRLVTSPSASLQAELPIAAGLVAEILSPYVGFEDLGLAPAFRRAVEQGSLAVAECDEGSLTHALYAGAGGLGFIPCPPGVAATDIPAVNPGWYRTTTDPFTGTEVVVVPALRPDVVFLACAESDEEGNVAFGRFPFTDRLLALAARTLVVQVERVVPAEALAERAAGETIPSFLVAAVVEAPGGCAPTGSPGFYDRDVAALGAYLTAAKDPDRLAAYLGEHWASAP